MNKLVLVLSLYLVVAGSAFAQGKPVDNVGNRHPNLEEAQRLCTQAWEKLVASQKAKELLDQVNREIKAAAEFDNHKGRR